MKDACARYITNAKHRGRTQRNTQYGWESLDREHLDGSITTPMLTYNRIKIWPAIGNLGSDSAWRSIQINVLFCGGQHHWAVLIKLGSDLCNLTCPAQEKILLNCIQIDLNPWNLLMSLEFIMNNNVELLSPGSLYNFLIEIRCLP